MKSVKNKLLLGAAGAWCLIASAGVNAAIIDVDLVDASWSDVVGGTNVTGVGTNEIRWGTSADASGERSGYRFDGAAPPTISVDTGVEFTLGEFTHFNFPIFAGGAIDSAQLNITVDLSIGGFSLSEGPFTFSFLHDETTNTSSTCCNDIVNFTNLLSSDTFNIGGTLYTLAITGFKVGDTVTTSFSTVEGQENTAELRAIFRTAVVVPEPAPIALLGLGLLAIVAMRKKVDA